MFYKSEYMASAIQSGLKKYSEQNRIVHLLLLFDNVKSRRYKKLDFNWIWAAQPIVSEWVLGFTCQRQNVKYTKYKKKKEKQLNVPLTSSQNYSQSICTLFTFMMVLKSCLVGHSYTYFLNFCSLLHSSFKSYCMNIKWY